ncbi:MAG TPA: rhomboid family intramembrane serine protease [Pasteurellaceae bacterium]|nr:rhomboid family intramembrane serine protease [Pasteurellaceae bacterium]
MLSIQSFQDRKFTALITALCIVIYFIGELGFKEPIFEMAHYPYYANEDTQIWRYLSHTLVHLSPMHIMFNLVWWWGFAGLIERLLGSGKLIAMYLIAGILSGVAQNMASGPAFFGLSGVVYAVLAYVFALDRFSSPSPLNLPQGFIYSLLLGIGIGLISPLFGVYMGNAAHITGFAIGLVWGFIDAKRYSALNQ